MLDSRDLAWMRAATQRVLPDLATISRGGTPVATTVCSILQQGETSSPTGLSSLEAVPLYLITVPYSPAWAPRSGDRLVTRGCTFDVTYPNDPHSYTLSHTLRCILLDDGSGNPIIAGLPANATVSVTRPGQLALPGASLYPSLRVRLVFPSMPATQQLDFGALSQTRLAATPDTDLQEADIVTILHIDGHTLASDRTTYDVQSVDRIPDPAAHILATLSGDLRGT